MGARLLGLRVLPVGGGAPPQPAGARAVVIGAQARGVRLRPGVVAFWKKGAQNGRQEEFISFVGLARHEIRPRRLVHRCPGA